MSSTSGCGDEATHPGDTQGSTLAPDSNRQGVAGAGGGGAVPQPIAPIRADDQRPTRPKLRREGASAGASPSRLGEWGSRGTRSEETADCSPSDLVPADSKGHASRVSFAKEDISDEAERHSRDIKPKKAKSLIVTEKDLKREIRKLESLDSIHADFARGPHPDDDDLDDFQTALESVNVTELCRKTSAGIGRQMSHDERNVGAVGSEDAPPSMEYSARRQLSDTNALPSFDDDGQIDVDEHRHSRLHFRHPAGNQGHHHHHHHKHKKNLKKESSPSQKAAAMTLEKPQAPTAPLISIDEIAMDEDVFLSASSSVMTQESNASLKTPPNNGDDHTQSALLRKSDNAAGAVLSARQSRGFSSEEEIASYSEALSLDHLRNIIPKADISLEDAVGDGSVDDVPADDADDGVTVDFRKENEDGCPGQRSGESRDIKTDDIPTVVVHTGTPVEEHLPKIKPSKKKTLKSGGSKGHRHNHRHHHHHHGKKAGKATSSHSETLLEEEQTLPMADVNDMSTHRLGDFHGLRRHKITPRARMASIVHVGQSAKSGRSFGRLSVDESSIRAHRRGSNELQVPKSSPVKKKFDHSPHEVFVELEELRVGETGEEMEWREMARWIKFEEDIEEGANRWGRPHVAILSFHSLLELRRGLELGTIILDLEEVDFPHIIGAIVEQMIEVGQIKEKNREDVLKALLLKHRQHQHDGLQSGESLLSRFQRNFSNVSFRSAGAGHEDDESGKATEELNMKVSETQPFVADAKEDRKSLIEDGRSIKGSNSLVGIPSRGDLRTEEGPRVVFTVGETDDELEKKNLRDDKVTSNLNRNNVAYKMPEETKDLHKAEILKKIPEGAEAFAVLVGAVSFLDQPAMGFVRLSEGRHLGNLTEVPLPVRFIFILLGPDDQEIVNYHEIGRSISTLMANTTFHESAYQAEEREVLLQAINEFLDDSVVLPPGAWNSKLLPKLAMENPVKRRKKRDEEKELLVPDGEKKPPPDGSFKRTGRPFGGAIRDARRRYRHYLSDFKDGLNMQCLASFFFIYFACLSPAITFGGLLADKTNNWIGVTETLVSTCVCGVIFSLLAGQPLLIIGYTGPLLVFEESLYEFCTNNDIQFIVFRAWVGIWIAIIAVLLVAAEGSSLASLLSRFSEEIFAFLISLIFVYEVFNKLKTIFEKNPLVYVEGAEAINSSVWNSSSISSDEPDSARPHADPNTGLLATILLFATFFIATYLKKFRNSQFLGRSIRRALGDFGIPIAIIIVVGFDLIIKDVWSQKLEVPDGIKPTDSKKRGWFINPLGIHGKTIPIWMPFVAVIPALLVFILIFIETLIASQIVNKKERNLKKGSGYHLDILLIGIMAGGCGIMGVPWHTAATVRSVAHTSSLSVMSKSHAPGEAPKLLEVKEQRLTNLLVNTMVGVSIALSSVLRKIPVPVLFGVFLYMGISSMAGIQFLTRIGLLFRPLKHHPQVGYVRKVRTYKMHLYTFIQIACLAVLWAVKSTAAALGFPFFLIMLIPLRKLVIPYLFTPKELGELDKEGIDDDDDEDPDIYEEAVVAD